MAGAPVSTPLVGGKAAIILFVATLVGFVLESQLSQYVQTTLTYRHPFFLFYIVHSAFALILPLHVAFLLGSNQGYTIQDITQNLASALSRHMLPSKAPTRRPPTVPVARFGIFVFVLTMAVTTPGILWFAAVSMAPLSDVTAIWNANAFFAYVFSVKIFKLKWESRKLAAVVLATLGVLAVVYGGSVIETPGEEAAGSEAQFSLKYKPSAPLVGDLLTLCASVGYGLYQPLYKKHATLPSDPDEVIPPAVHYSALPDADTDGDEQPARPIEDATDPLPFGLYANLLTCAIGLCTFLVLWIPLPFLHWTGIEEFALPANMLTVFSIAGIAVSGMVFNAGFMILLGVWGPIVVSVGYLLVIVLVFLSDMVFGDAWQTVTLWSISGAAAIVVAFGVLAVDMLKST